MKKSKYIICIILIFCFQNNISAQEPITISSTEDLEEYINLNNFDLKLLQEQARQADARVNSIQGSYDPVLTMEASYSDDDAESNSPFQPSHIRNVHLEAVVSQRTKNGLRLSLGLLNDRTRIYQTIPANEQLPFPATLNKPTVVAKIEMDLLHNFMGYVSSKEINQVELDEEIINIQKAAVQRKLFLTSSSLLWNLQIVDAIREHFTIVIDPLKKLEKDVARKVKKGVFAATNGIDLNYDIAQKEMDIAVLTRRMEDIKKAMIDILAAENKIQIEPIDSMSLIKDKISQCENFILDQTEIKRSWSGQFDILSRNVRQGELEKQIRSRKSLPNMNLYTSYGLRGNDTSEGESFSELFDVKSPQLVVGLNFSWPISSSLGHANKTIGDVAYQSAKIAESQYVHQSQAMFTAAKEKIQQLKTESDLMNLLLEHRDKQDTDLLMRYRQGRVSIFEYLVEKNSFMRTKVQHKELWAHRVNNIFQFLSHFDKLKCGNSGL